MSGVSCNNKDLSISAEADWSWATHAEVLPLLGLSCDAESIE